MNRILLFCVAVLAFSFGVSAFANAQVKIEAAKTLVVYFSATGNTARSARLIADVTGAKLFEIVPEKVYTGADLNWNDDQSRSSVEMNDPKARPALSAKADVTNCDVIFIGYPIWWNQAPRIINTFIESHDLKGKLLIPFATSGGSSINNSVKQLEESYPDLNWHKGRMLNNVSRGTVEKWIKGLK